MFAPGIAIIINPEAAETERNDGIRPKLRLAPVYRAVQRSIGGERTRQRVRNEVIRSSADDLIVDIGCRTGEIADYVLFSGYHGFDPHEKYVDEARSRLIREFGDRVSVFVGSIRAEGIDARLPARADLVTSIGVPHHMDDELADSLLELAAQLAGGSARFVSLDLVHHDGQPAVARFLTSRNRGQHFRRSGEAEALVRRHFSAAQCTVHHDLLRVPYAHAAIRVTNS